MIEPTTYTVKTGPYAGRLAIKRSGCRPPQGSVAVHVVHPAWPFPTPVVLPAEQLTLVKKKRK